MLKSLNIYNGLLTTILTLAVFSSYKNSDRPEEETPHPTPNTLPQVITSIPLPAQADFAGEPLPLDNFDVRERLDRELTVNSYWHSSTILALKEAARHFPVIEPILQEFGVPDDFKYLAVAESGLRNAVSPAGARGVWQFLKKVGQHYGLEINSEVDERYHLEKATRAAARYLLDLKERFGSWTLAAAAYNMGETRLQKELDLQRAASYYELNLNEETSRYLFRLVALKYLFENPRTFGFYLDSTDLYQPLAYRIVEVDSAIENLGDFARQNGTTYRLLKVFNPWLRTARLSNPNRKLYQIKIPLQTLPPTPSARDSLREGH